MAKAKAKAARDPAKARAQLDRARRAEELVNNPLFIEALDAIQKVIDEGWKNSSAEDREARDNAYMLHRLLSRFRGHFKSIVVSGHNAKALLQQEEDLSGGSSP